MGNKVTKTVRNTMCWRLKPAAATAVSVILCFVGTTNLDVEIWGHVIICEVVGSTKEKGWPEKTEALSAAEDQRCLTAVAQGCDSGTSRSTANIDAKTQQSYTVLAETNILYFILADSTKSSFTAVNFFFFF